MKLFINLLLMLTCSMVYAQNVYRGRVISALDKSPVGNATVTLKNNGIVVLTGSDGTFILNARTLPDSLVVTTVGYDPETLLISRATDADIIVELTARTIAIQEVNVNTGYYSIPQERATGSFTLIDNELLNRSVSTDIISRLEGVANGVQFDRTGVYAENGESPRLRVRGLSTIHSDASPLIVVDNFPYEGDINDINPNDVENITVLKDAAAASIWGARAGNGVIVITTKSGKYEQPVALSFNSNLNIVERPDLHYSPDFIPSAAWLPVERFLFERGFYGEEDDFSPLPPFVELLIRQRDGLISETDFETQKAVLERSDVRDDAFRYLYRNALNQQYAMNIRGGTIRNRFYISGGYDRNLDNVIGDAYKRVNLSVNNSVRLSERLELGLGMYYTDTRRESNGVTLSDIRPTGFISTPPYTRLIDGEGNHLPTVANLRIPYYESAESLGLLDWAYRPLDEPGLSNDQRRQNRVRFDGSLKYRFSSALAAQLSYQYQGYGDDRGTLNTKDSYYVRNLVNRFTQENGTRVIPYGDIRSGSHGKQRTHFGRVQLNYDDTFSNDHRISALAGAELRGDQRTSDRGYLVYGYDGEVLTFTDALDYTTSYPTRPQGRAKIPNSSSGFSHLTERNISYFGNASYTYKERYILSLSSRWDGSNLFGVKTNQKGVPLWSAGLSWNLSDERFWNAAPVPYLRLRTTYGVNGNVNRDVSALPSVSYSTDYMTQLPVAILRNAGNPSLRWEKVKAFNAGMDFGLFGRRLSGSVQYFVKNAADLIGERYLDPTTGVGSLTLRNRVNYASMRTEGWDIELNSENLRGAFRWNTTLLLNYSDNRITDYEFEDNFLYSNYLGAVPPPRVGKSRDIVYALPWRGLDRNTGFPLVETAGQPGMEYTGYLNSLTYDDLLVSGVGVPRYYGAMRNTFGWHGLSVSVNLTWKAGYVFRRNSVDYNQLFNMGMMHADFLDRWMAPGDEEKTDIPAMPTDVNNNRDYVFLKSEYLVESGNHLRLQDIRISYLYNSGTWLSKLPINDVRLSVYANNVAMIWQKSKSGLDPDYPNALYPNPRSIAFGIQVNF